MLLKYKHFTFLLLILFFSSSQAAHAYIFDAFIIESYELPLIIDTSVGSYEMSTIFGSYESERAVLESQPWWNNITLTEEFTSLTSDLLGYPNTIPESDPFPAIQVGPAFAAGINPIIDSDGERDSLSGCALVNIDIVCFPHVELTAEFDFAIATQVTTEPVSEPATGLLFAISLIMLIFTNRKNKIFNHGR